MALRARALLQGAARVGSGSARRQKAYTSAKAFSPDSSEHAAFLREIVGVEPPRALGPLVRMLEARGMQLSSPNSAKRLRVHPLLVPLATSEEGEVTTGLVVPAHAGYGLHVANARAEHHGALELQALSAEQLAAGMLAQEDAETEGKGGELVRACGHEDASALHALGSVDAGNIKAHLVRQIGGLPKVVETLARDHFNAGNDTSALVTADWYKRGDHFPGWAQPLRFTSLLMADIGKQEEARDTSRAALACAAWWTLGSSFEHAATDAQMAQGGKKMSARDIKDLLSGAAFTAEGMPQGMVQAAGEQEDPVEKAHNSATFAFDKAVAGESTFDEAARNAAESLRSAGAMRAASLLAHHAQS